MKDTTPKLFAFPAFRTTPALKPNLPQEKRQVSSCSQLILNPGHHPLEPAVPPAPHCHRTETSLDFSPLPIWGSEPQAASVPKMPYSPPRRAAQSLPQDGPHPEAVQEDDAGAQQEAIHPQEQEALEHLCCSKCHGRQPGTRYMGEHICVCREGMGSGSQHSAHNRTLTTGDVTEPWNLRQSCGTGQRRGTCAWCQWGSAIQAGPRHQDFGAANTRAELGSPPG